MQLFLAEMDKLILKKFIWKCKDHKIAKVIFKKEEQN